MEPSVTLHTSIPSRPIPAAVADEGPVLLAALAAALVEYRRHVEPANPHSTPEGVGSNWRSLARWDQLQGSV